MDPPPQLSLTSPSSRITFCPFRCFLSFSDNVRHGRVQAGGGSILNHFQGPIGVYLTPDLMTIPLSYMSRTPGISCQSMVFRVREGTFARNWDKCNCRRDPGPCLRPYLVLYSKNPGPCPFLPLFLLVSFQTPSLKVELSIS